MPTNDGYVGLFSVPEAGIDLVKIGNTANLTAIETGLENDSEFHNPTYADVTISDLDVTAGSVNTICVDWRTRRTSINTSSGDYDDVSGAGESWNAGTAQNVDYAQGTNTSYVYTTTVGGLPTNIGGTTHHCLRMSFLNGANVAGTIASTDGDGSNKRAGTASWASNIYTFACTANPAWTADDHKGRLVKFLDASDNFLFSLVCYSNTNDDILCYVPEDPVDAAGITTTAVAKAWIPDHNYLYDVGLSGYGEDFNGVDDLIEFSEVANLAILVGGAAEYGDGVDVSLASSTVTLTWDNMYNYSGVANWPLAVSEGEDSPDAETQKTMAITNAKWKHVSEYGIYMFVSSDGSGPNNQWPVGTDANADKMPGGEDEHGQWYLFDEIPAVQSDSPATISHTIDVPGGSQLAFWVGAKGATTWQHMGGNDSMSNDIPGGSGKGKA